MGAELTITIDRTNSEVRVACAGELDISGTPRLRRAIARAMGDGPKDLHLDLRGLSLVTSAGIEIILETVAQCREDDVKLRLSCSRVVRRVLDLVGLWWVGVVDDGLSIEQHVKGALRNYAELRYDQNMSARKPEEDLI